VVIVLLVGVLEYSSHYVSAILTNEHSISRIQKILAAGCILIVHIALPCRIFKKLEPEKNNLSAVRTFPDEQAKGMYRYTGIRGI
jgi:hypothetical protein